MSELERAWRAWRVLSRPDRVRFLALFRGAYAQERAAAVRRRGGGRGRRGLRLADVVLSEGDLQRLGL